jgi:hypothetical protein
MISHKRYLEWLGDLPAGPSSEEIKAKEQIKMDYELWDNIVHGRTDPPKKKHKIKVAHSLTHSLSHSLTHSLTHSGSVQGQDREATRR